MSQRTRTVLLWVLLVVVFVAIYQLVSDDDTADLPGRTTSELAADLDRGEVVSVGYDEDASAVVTTVDGGRYRVPWSESSAELYQRAAEDGLVIQLEREGSWGAWWPVLIAVAIVVVIVGLVMRRLRAGQQGLFEMRRTTARLVSEVPQVGWDDVGGAAEAKAYLRDTLDFLRHPRRWEKAGARLPSGVLLEGPPGYGKTLLAKALAGEAKLPFFEVSASELVELFVGVGAARVRDLFDSARSKAPCVVFIDEIDAVARKRGGSIASLTHQEREQALNQLLVSMDGFRSRDRIVVLAATNRADVLDPALLRPGRFDIVLRVGDFSATDRVAVLKVHTKTKPLASDVDLEAIAAITEGMSGAELEQICNTAALAAARRAGEPRIAQADLVQAVRSRAARPTDLDRLDLFLAEASAGVARPTGTMRVELTLRSGEAISGELVWGDPGYLKIARAPRNGRDGRDAIVISRSEVATVRALSAPGVIDDSALAAAGSEVPTTA